MARGKKGIDLLVLDEFGKTPLGKFLSWALTIGRYIVIVTELVVLAAFFYRFKLDANLSTLGEKIKNKQAIIESFGDLEDKVRNIQKRLAVIKKTEEKKLDAEKLLTEIGKATPANIYFTTITYSDGKINCEGIALTEIELSKLIKEMEKSDYFSQVSLENLIWGGTEKPQLNFIIKAETIKSEKTEKE